MLLMALMFVVPSGGVVHADSQITIPVKVSFSGSSLPTENFSVALVDKDGSAKATGSVTLSAGKDKGDISLGLDGLSPGEYTYELKEIDGGNPDITYSKTVYTYHILVKNDGATEMKAVNKENPDDKPDKVEFTNSYVKKGPDEVIGDPPVRVIKDISGKKPPKVDRFVFIMRPENPENPLPDVKAAGSGVIKDGVAEVYLNGEGEVEIGNIAFTKEGIYRYFVEEKDTAVAGYNYDDARFTVVYNVSRNQEGALTCERTITGKGSGTVNNCTFDNIYDPNPVTGKLRRAVKTGDPAVMWPITIMVIMVIVMGTMLVDRKNRREYESWRREKRE